LKKIAILGTVVVLLGCSTATVADDHKTSNKTENYFAIVTPSPSPSIFTTAKHMIILEQQAAVEKANEIAEQNYRDSLIKNSESISNQVDELSQYIAKTRYVFSGSQPSGWDCSGMTRWFYAELGFDIPHSANKQGQSSGTEVKDPKIGDIVAVSYSGSSKYYHVGIYIGDNQMIHAGFKPGTRTEIISLDSPAFNSSNFTFKRIIEN
jgi:cell wall-associated NlpC family hydrolase